MSVTITATSNSVTVDATTNTVTITAPGPIGAQGPTGPTGPQGATGPQGSSGVIAVTSPITNTGTSTSAQLGLDQTALSITPAQTQGTAVITTDARLTDARTPTGAAGGDLTGTYPSPTLAAVVTAGTATKVTFDAKGRITAGTTLAAADIPTITTAQVAGTAVITTDARLSDSRTPTGAAGGALTGTYPNPTLGSAAFATVLATGTAIAAGTALTASRSDHVHSIGTGTIGTAALAGDFALALSQLSQSGATTNQAPIWNGTAWTPANVDALPAQSGNSGRFLTTNGSAASWGRVAAADLFLNLFYV